MSRPRSMLPRRDDLRALPQFAPLLAAVLAPLSTLLDIPAYTEHWFFSKSSSDGTLTPLPDPHTNLSLSLAGLIFNIIANGLLIVRFSVGNRTWRIATRVSLGNWVLKFGIALGNVLAYGILTRNEPGISYGEGFWCAVMSLLIATVIVFLLTVHYWYEVSGHEGEDPTENQVQVRIAGRHFMLQTTLFVSTVGLLALFMSRIEQWTYLQGIYFSIVAFLTVGFGDFYPTKAASQIVFFPFALVGIVQLASIIELIIRFFRDRLASHNTERIHAYQKKRHEEESKLEKEPNLESELAFLKELFEETSQGKAYQDLATSIAGFISFWLIGAVIFSQIESWTYGQGLYFCYIFFFTVGFGDYSPITPAGRVVFVVYSIIAVPIMSSFAVQTIQSIFQTASQKLFRKQEAYYGVGVGGANALADDIAQAEDREGDEEKQVPEDAQKRLQNNDCARRNRLGHHEFVDKEHRTLDKRLSSFGRDPKEDEAERRREEDRILTEYVLEMVVELERHARRLIMGHMDEDSAGNLLLRADRIVQLRNIKRLAGQEEFPVLSKSGDRPCGDGDSTTADDADDTREKTGQKNVSEENRSSASVPNPLRRLPHTTTLMKKYYAEEADLVPFPTSLDEQETMEEVARYREAFAGLLAAGSRLLKLKDRDRALFERRYWTDDQGDTE